MTGSNKIPEALEPELQARAGQLNPETARRWTTRELAAWLRKEHGVEVNHTTVGRCLQRLRAEAAAVRQAAARDALAKALRTSLRRLRDYERRLAEKVPENAKAGTLASTMELQRRVVDTLAKHGLGEKVEAAVDVTSDGKALTVYLPAEDGGPSPPTSR